MVPATLAMLTTTLVLALVYFHFYAGTRRAYLLIWATAWLAYAVRMGLALLVVQHPHPAWLILNQTAALASGVLLLWGTYRFLDRRMPIAWHIASGLCLAWIIVITPFDQPSAEPATFTVLSLPTFTFLGIVTAMTGVVLLRYFPEGRIGRYLAGLALIAWGVHKLNYPFLRPIEEVAPWGYSFSSVLAILTAVGILLAYSERAASELTQSERRFRDVIDSVADGLFVHDGAGRLVDVNPEACRSLGYARDDLLRMRIGDIEVGIPPAERSATASRVAQGQSARLEGRQRRRDGTSFPVEVHLSPLAVGQETYVLALARDLSARYEAEKKLQRELAVNRALADLSNALIDPANTIDDIARHVLRSAKQLTASEHGFVSTIDPNTGGNIGHTLTEMMDNECQVEGSCIGLPREDGTYDRLWGVALNTRKGFFTNNPSEHEHASGLPAGHIPLVNFLAVPALFGADLVGEIALANTAAGFAQRDIDAVERLAALFALAVQRHRAGEQKDALEERLREAQKLQALGQLAGGIAHDFNNLLVAILGNAEFIAHGEDVPDEAASLARNIVQAGERAADMTRQLLTFARRSPMQMAALDLHDVVREVRGLLSHSIDRRVEVRAELGARHATVVGDATQLQNALLNLCVNARDAMPGGGTLTIATANVELDAESCQGGLTGAAPGPFVELRVTDTGVGMDEKTRARVFEPFFTTKPVGQGTGLGLASVYGCVQAHHGVIRVESRPGAGTSVRVALPLAPRGDANAGQSRPELVRGSGHVLVVDDEELIRLHFERVLTRLGYRVTLCEDGERALEAFDHAGDVDLVILDMVMPRLSGAETLARLRQRAPNVPVVVCSGFTQDAMRDEMQRLGVSAVLAKPFTATELAATVADAFGVRKEK